MIGSLGLDEARRVEGLRAAAEQRAAESRAITYEMGQQAGWVDMPNTSGVTVSPYSAFQVSAWWCGIEVKSGDMSVLDWRVFRRVGNDDRERATGHAVQKVLDQPNEFMCSQVFWQTIFAHQFGWGNGYAEIEWDNAGRPLALWPILPCDIEPVVQVVFDNQGRQKSKLWYRYRGQYRLEAENVLHFPGLGFDGIRGYSVVTLARQTLGTAMAASQFGGAFFGNGTWMGVGLQSAKVLGAEGRENLRQSVNEMHQGAKNAFKLFVVEDGLTFANVPTVSPKEAQSVETQEHYITEVARYLNIPPHKIKHKMGERPGGNLETAENDYYVTSLLAPAKRTDQILTNKLISNAQRATHYVEHNPQARLQATSQERAVVQRLYQAMGVLDADQIARQENLPKPKPKALPPVAEEPVPPARPAPPRPDEPRLPAGENGGDRPRWETRQALAVSAQRALYVDAAGRFVRREGGAAKRACKKGSGPFEAWAEEFYGEMATRMGAILEPAVRIALAAAGSEGDARQVAQGLAEGYAARSKGELLALKHHEIEAAVPRLLERWETTRTVEMADQIAALAAEEKADAA